MDIQKEFGLGVKQLRKNGCKSKEIFAFCRYVDIDRTYLAFVGAGRGNVSLNNIKKIADGFNIVLARCFIRSSAWIKALPINVMIVLLHYNFVMGDRP